MSSRALKVLAACAMLADHIGYVFMTQFTPEWYIFRGFGRIAFPIFCYLICRGYEHTSSLPKYMGRLLLFAGISEIPYDLCFSKTAYNPDKCNVFVTLLLGLISVTAAGTGAKYVMEKLKAPEKLRENVFMQTLCALPVIAGCMWTAKTLHSDYGWAGVAIIYIIFLFRKNEAAALTALGIANCLLLCIDITPAKGFFGVWTFNFMRTIQWFAPLACLPLGFYNGKKGSEKLKRFFYVFYPTHLMVLWLVWKVFI